MADIKVYNVDALGKPVGPYSHVARVKSAETLYIAGMVSPAEGFEAQCAAVYAQIEQALKASGGGWKNVVQFTTYLVHSQDVPKLRAFRQREFGKLFPNGAYPPNTLLIIDRLVNESYLIEVQTVAAL